MDYMTILIYVGLILGLLLLGFGWVKYISPKLTDKNKDELALILQVIDYLNKNVVEWKYSGELSTIVKYSLEGLAFVDEFNTTLNADAKSVLVKEKTLLILREKGIIPDSDLITLVDEILKFVVK